MTTEDEGTIEVWKKALSDELKMTKTKKDRLHWLVAAREHINDFFTVDSPGEAIDKLVFFSNMTADTMLVEMVATAMEKAYEEAKHD